MVKETLNVAEFEKKVDDELDGLEKNLGKKLKIIVVGKVSTGKSSLVNALFNRSKKNQIAEVGAESGKTTKVNKFKLGKNIEICDSPGLDDIKEDNSQETKNALNDMDVGILVITGSADKSQLSHYQELKVYCKKVFVVLNKIDEYEKKPKALEKVIHQWQEKLEMSKEDKIYPTCTDGYDPDFEEDAELNIVGVDELRTDVLDFLKEHGKDLIFARETEKKSTIAKRIIYTAMVAAAGFAFIPGSAIYITGAQAAAIVSIHYVYTGEILSKKSAIAAIPLFASQSIGSNIFLWAKSVLPPTGVLDLAAAGVAMGVTLAMLSTVNWMYESGYNFDDKSELKEQYGKIFKMLKAIGLGEIFNIVKSGNTKNIMDLISRFVK